MGKGEVFEYLGNVRVLEDMRRELIRDRVRCVNEQKILGQKKKYTHSATLDGLWNIPKAAFWIVLLHGILFFICGLLDYVHILFPFLPQGGNIILRLDGKFVPFIRWMESWFLGADALIVLWPETMLDKLRMIAEGSVSMVILAALLVSAWVMIKFVLNTYVDRQEIVSFEEMELNRLRMEEARKKELEDDLSLLARLLNRTEEILQRAYEIPVLPRGYRRYEAINRIQELLADDNCHSVEDAVRLYYQEDHQAPAASAAFHDGDAAWEDKMNEFNCTAKQFLEEGMKQEVEKRQERTSVLNG